MPPAMAGLQKVMGLMLMATAGMQGMKRKPKRFGKPGENPGKSEGN